MKVGLIGSRGKAGKYILAELAKTKHSIKILAYHDMDMPDHPGVEIFRGDGNLIEDIQNFIWDCDVIINSAGRNIFQKPFYSNISNNIIISMGESAKRYIAVSNAAVIGHRTGVGWKVFWMNRMMKLFFGRFISDREHELELLKASRINWVLIQLPIILEKTKYVGVKGNESELERMFVSQSHIAEFIANEVDANIYAGKSIYIYDWNP